MAQLALTERAKWLSERSVRAHSWFTVIVHCRYTLSLYTVHVHCQCCHCLLSLYMVHCILALYAVTAPLHTAHHHYTLSLYIVTVHCTLYCVHCTLYIVHCTLYSPRSHRMYPHTQYVRHNGQDSTLALYTVTLHLLYALIVRCHCTLSL